jgi:tripeptide aminopeptidase
MSARAISATGETFRDLTRERRWLSELDDDILRAQMEVAQIPAPTGSEDGRARWMAARFAETGLASRIDAAGNVIARIPGAYEDAPVVVCAHLDTVFPADTSLAVHREGSRVRGPGICDNGRGLAVMASVARAVQRCRTGFARAVEFVATTGEEGAGDLRGAKHYFAHGGGPSPFAVIALDGAGDERIVNTALGSRRFRIEYRGPGGHSWSAFGAANPVHAAARAASAIAGLRLENASRSCVTVSRIGGGLSVNSIPEDAWLEVDVRSTNDEALARIERQIREIATSVTAEENQRRAPSSAALTYVVTRIGDRPGGHTADDSPLVVAAVHATRLVGRTPEFATASTDANAAMGFGVPAIAIGGGGHGGDAHSRREWFDNTAASAGVERAFTIVATMARIAAD